MGISMAWQLMPSSVCPMPKSRESTTRLRHSDGRGTVILTMNTSSLKSSMPAEGSTSETRHHTEKVIEPTFSKKCEKIVGFYLSDL